MPTRKPDAHRALELLEEYHSQLNASEDTPLRSAIERVIRIFRSRLFQALLDIQQFYEETLLDGNKTTSAKTTMALEMASRWEKQSPLPGGPSDRGRSASLPRGSPAPHHTSGSTSSSLSRDANGKPDRRGSDNPDAGASAATITTAATASAAFTPTPVTSTPASAGVSEKSDYEEHVIMLQKQPGRGLGFSIAGGIGNNHIPDDNGIFVTAILENGVALQDNRLRANDCLLRVNDTSLDNVTHAVAVQALKDTPSNVVLHIRRKKATDSADARPVTLPRVQAESPQPPKSEYETITMTLVKHDKGLGFSIAGGVNNEHINGDSGIFVTRIVPGGVAEQDGRMSVNDRILKVNETSLINVAHSDAVGALQRASGPTLLVIQRTSYSKALQENAYASVVQPLKKYCSDQRAVTLHKQKGSGLGFNIVGGEDVVYISFIMSGGIADINGQLKRGDKILEVNNVDLSHGSHDKAASVLRGASTKVEMIVAYRPEEYGSFERKIQTIREKMPSASPGGTLKTSMKTSKYVRAQFSYDRTRDPGLPGEGLSFSLGDILHVVNASDEEWWQARKVNLETGEDEGPQGVIPSRQRVQRKERLRLRSVKFVSGSDTDEKPEKEKINTAKARGGSVGRRRSFTISMRLPFFKKSAEKDKKAQADSQGEEPVLSYVDVHYQEIRYKRPIVILGPLKDRVNDSLQQDMPDQYGSCVPHTTRRPREFEVNGRDYHFVPNRQAMETDIQNHLFIDAGTYNDNLYGTSIEAVRTVAVEQQKHCVLDVSGYAIRRLQVAGLHPIAIFLKPTSIESIRDQNRRMTDEQAQKTYERALKLETEFAEHYTAVISADSFDEAYTQVKNAIKYHAGPRIWATGSPDE